MISMKQDIFYVSKEINVITCVYCNTFSAILSHKKYLTWSMKLGGMAMETTDETFFNSRLEWQDVQTFFARKYYRPAHAIRLTGGWIPHNDKKIIQFDSTFIEFFSSFFLYYGSNGASHPDVKWIAPLQAAWNVFFPLISDFPVCFWHEESSKPLAIPWNRNGRDCACVNWMSTTAWGRLIKQITTRNESGFGICFLTLKLTANN